MTIDVYSVYGLTAYIHGLLRQDDNLQDVWVQGEASNVRRAASGHWYFTIKDADAQLRCVIFKPHADRQRLQLRDGDLINVHGAISIYEKRGEYQLVADVVQAAGLVGDLYQQFEALKAKLDAEGMFAQERKQPLPDFPLRVGVVTSPDAAAFQDVRNVLSRRLPLLQVVLSPTLVQGNEAPPQIVRAIQRLNAYAQLDAIIVCRGGGSIEDLWCFNDERVARAIAASALPVISGVGHETDFTIADFVADYRAPTPSAAAEVVTPITEQDLRQQLAAQNAALTFAVRTAIGQRQDDLNATTRTLHYVSPQQFVNSTRQRIDDWQTRINSLHKRHLALLRERLAARTAALQAASPQAILKRGYAIVTDSSEGKPITSAQDAQVGQGVTLQFQDGKRHARIENEEIHGRYKRTLF